MKKNPSASSIFNEWIEGLRKPSHDLPAKGSLAGALVVLERLKSEWSLRIDDHTAKGGSQIIGTSGARVAELLAQFGEIRPFLSEGGRTNRGLRGDVEQLLKTLEASGANRLTTVKRERLLTEIQKRVVSTIQLFFNLKRLEFTFQPTETTWQAISDLLEQSRGVGKEGPVAQYLVGAKLTRRFPEEVIRNESSSTSDVQSGEQGDFKVRSTIFHVTVAPMQGVFEKCQKNLSAGFRAYLLVPDRVLLGARQQADGHATRRISVESIETFVAQNIDELSLFSSDARRHELLALLTEYNTRVDAVENDKSLLIDIPVNLKGG